MKLRLLGNLFFMSIMYGARDAVTYEHAGGRFGDQLMTYVHAKYIAHTCGLPLLYRPFPYSSELMLHGLETVYTSKRKFNQIIKVSRRAGGPSMDLTLEGTKDCLNLLRKVRSVPEDDCVLYLVPYFPESHWERVNGKDADRKPWSYFDVDWYDESFIAELRRTIAPVKPLERLNIPTGRISVAAHIRRGGYCEKTADGLKGFPLKFLKDDFFITWIRNFYHMLGERPLYVHIFTDDIYPAYIMENYQRQLSGLDIQFGCREKDNSERENVIEDFFAMQQFDCLIHSESNYSLLASKIGNYMLSVYPDSFQKVSGGVIYNNVVITRRPEHPKFHVVRP